MRIIINALLAVVCVFAFIPQALAITPDEFSERLDNMLQINNAIAASNPTPQETFEPPTSNELSMLVAKMKTEFKEAYLAKESKNKPLEDSNYESLMADFILLQSNLQVDLGPLKLLVMEEFGKAPMPTFAIQRKASGKSPVSTVIIRGGSPTPKNGLIPTISPSQLRGRKNFIYALGDIFWENKLLIGVFLAGMLIVYALYSRKEEETALEYSGD